MASYPVPPWLSPSAALGYGQLAGEAQRAALTAQVQRERMAQESVQAGMEMQQRQQQLAQESAARAQELQQSHLVTDQKIQIDKAYKDAEIGLRTQDMDLAQKEFQAKTQMAAQRFSAQQSFQKAVLPVEQGGEGLTPQAAALKYMAPYMTPDAAGRIASLPAPFQIGKPQAIEGHPDIDAIQTSRNGFRLVPKPPTTATNAPAALPIHDENGQVIGHWAQPPGGGKPQRISQTKTKSSGLEEAINKYKASQSGTADKPAPTNALGPNEVIRMTGDGKRAVFDSKTKKFVRWAEQPTPSNAAE